MQSTIQNQKTISNCREIGKATGENWNKKGTGGNILFNQDPNRSMGFKSGCLMPAALCALEAAHPRCVAHCQHTMTSGAVCPELLRLAAYPVQQPKAPTGGCSQFCSVDPGEADVHASLPRAPHARPRWLKELRDFLSVVASVQPNLRHCSSASCLSASYCRSFTACPNRTPRRVE